MDAFLEPLDDNDTVAEQIGEILRNAQNTSLKITDRLVELAKAEQLLLTKDQSGHLLDNFLDEMLEFASYSDHRLKCFVALFIEKACMKDPEVMKKGVGSLSLLLTTGSSSAGFVKVMKRVITVCANLYPYMLKWAVSRRADHEVEKCWESFCVLKGRIMQNIETENEGVRTMTLKFLESVVLAQSLKTDESESGRGDLMCLNEVSRDHRFISYRKMQAEANHTLQSLLDQMALSHISSQNLLTVLNVVCVIARQRPEYAGKVLDALEVLHVNLPPTLGTSQVKSVRKELKMHLLRILRNASAFPFHARIITLLTDLGATQGEMNRAMPSNINELRRKAKRSTDASQPSAKKARQETRLEDDEYAEETENTEEPIVDSTKQSAIDITADFIFDRLNPTVVTNMVFIALMTLPDQMPATFASSYTPIAAAGTEAQRRHLSRMMATQATQQELGPGVEQMRKEKLEKFNERQSARREGAYIPPTPATHLGRPAEKKPFAVPKLPAPTPAPVAPKVKLAFNLVSATQELNTEETMDLFNMAFARIMNAERRAVQGGAGQLHQVILVRLASRFHTTDAMFEQLMMDFIVEEHKMRTDLALLWVAELYAQYQGFSFCYQLDRPDGRVSTSERMDRYDRIMCGLLSKLYEKGHHKEAAFHKILLDAPLVTSNALQWLKVACLDKVYGAFGMTTLRELILTRSRQRCELLHLLFELTFYDQPDTNLRQSCVETLKELCELAYLKNDVREQLIAQLQLCTQPTPPPYFVPNADAADLAWDESVIRNALLLYLAVLPMDATLFLPLADTYSNASKDFKKVVLRSVDTAVRSIGIHNKEMLRLVEECPIGAETLLARVVHLLTERNPVTKDLVVRLKKLHDERHTDVRSMIPVLNGLSKEDIVKILPQFVLRIGNQKTVSSVFKKLLTGRNIDTGEPVLSGVELMMEYHMIEPSTSEEADTQVDNLRELLDALSKETIANSVEGLLDLRPLPVLFYSTLVQVYKKCPSLDGFLSNVVHKLISKELWKEADDSKHAFFKTLTQLRTVGYTSILTGFNSDEFKEYVAYHEARGTRDDVIRSLRDYLPSLSTHQQKSISSTVMDMVKDRDDRRERDREERDRDRERDKARDERREKERERERERERGRRDRDRRESRRSYD